MLVLSRRETEKVLFPSLGITVEVLRVRGKSTRLGIAAPPDTPILRHEIADRKFSDVMPDARATSEQLRELAHAVRRRLDGAATILNQLHAQLDDDRHRAAQQIVMDLFHDLQSLEREANLALDGTPAAKAISVLVVEDSIIERKFLAGVIELAGMNVTAADDGQEALEYLSLHAVPDAVLLDMLMPRCDGPAFVESVRSNPRYEGMKIYAVSSTDPSELGLIVGEGGLDGWFPKPLDPGELLCVLRERLQDARGNTRPPALTGSTTPS